MAAPLAHADFQDDYALGLKSIDDGRYADARMYLQRALDAQPGPVVRVILNGNVEQPYLPLHFLGIVAFRLGECDAAREQWESPANQKMLGRLHAIRRLEQRMVASCKPKAAAVAKAPAAQSQQPPAAAPAPPAAATQVAEASPQQAPAAGSPAKPPTRPAQPPPAAKSEAPAPPPAARPAPAPAGSAAAPPARLVRALDSYLAGRYDEAARIAPDSLPAGRARFHAYLVRSAARYTLAQMNGDEGLLGQARTDAVAAKAIDAATVPDSMAFSPKFRAFYAAAR